MDFNFPQRVRLGQGVTQQLGAAVKEAGDRALIVTEAGYDKSKELALLTQSLEKAGVQFMVLPRPANQTSAVFIKDSVKVARASRSDAVVTLGGSDLLSLGRVTAMEIGTAGEAALPLFEVPTAVCFPLLMREEAFLSSGHPSDLKFVTTKVSSRQQIFLDPHIGAGVTPKTLVSALLETLFFAVEAHFHEDAGQTEQSLLLGAVENLWSSLKKVLENPANVEYKLTVYQAGFSIALALALIPRCSGLSLGFVLAGITGLPSASLGSLFLASFLEVFGAKGGARMRSLARAFGFFDPDDTEEALGARTAQEVRRFLNSYSLPTRLADYKMVESQLSLSVDVVKGLGLARGGILGTDRLPEFLKLIG